MRVEAVDKCGLEWFDYYYHKSFLLPILSFVFRSLALAQPHQEENKTIPRNKGERKKKAIWVSFVIF